MWDVFFHLIRYQSVILRFFVPTGVELRRNDDISQAQKELLKTVSSSEELAIVWRRTCKGLLLIQVEAVQWKNDRTVEEERSSLQSNVAAVLVFSVRETAETLTRFPNNVAKWILWNYTCYKVRKNDGTYVDGVLVSIYRLYVRPVVVMRCSVEMKNLVGY